MKRVMMLMAITILAGVSTAHAQKPDAVGAPLKPVYSPGEPSMTPEMWFYQQEQAKQTPKNAVHEKAAFEAEQRERRIASMQWFGQSNSRPMASPDPIHGTYSPRWVSNSIDPSRWSAVGGGTAILMPVTPEVRRF